MTTTEQPSSSIYQSLETALTLCSNYARLAKDTFFSLWQHNEFRLLVYLFGALSALPVATFLVFCTVVVTGLAFGATILGCIICSLGFLVLIPFLVGAMMTAITIVLVYQAWLYFAARNQGAHELDTPHADKHVDKQHRHQGKIA
ncbi:hypothetical protein BC940DRAFT_300493 [Gongronella butleri]|nr:hypothetical protein BC940DRAFT_300493 [Gongronella butleri]